MNLFKTIIKKFLWFDITPRKHLYNELNECYEQIEELNSVIVSLKEDNLSFQRQIWDYEEHIHQLQERLDDLTYEPEDEWNSTESY